MIILNTCFTFQLHAIYMDYTFITRVLHFTIHITSSLHDFTFWSSSVHVLQGNSMSYHLLCYGVEFDAGPCFLLSTASLINIQFSLFWSRHSRGGGQARVKGDTCKRKAASSRMENHKYKAVISITCFMRKSSVQNVLLWMLSKIVFHLPVIRLIRRPSSAYPCNIFLHFHRIFLHAHRIFLHFDRIFLHASFDYTRAFSTVLWSVRNYGS